MSDGAVHVAVCLQFTNQPKCVVQNDDSVFRVKRWSDVGKSLCASQTVVVVDLTHHKDVDVILAVPCCQSFHRGFSGACHSISVADAALGVAIQCGPVDAHDAIGRLSLWCAFGQFELNAGVHSNSISWGAWRLAEIVVQSFNG